MAFCVGFGWTGFAFDSLTLGLELAGARENKKGGESLTDRQVSTTPPR